MQGDLQLTNCIAHCTNALPTTTTVFGMVTGVVSTRICQCFISDPRLQPAYESIDAVASGVRNVALFSLQTTTFKDSCKLYRSCSSWTDAQDALAQPIPQTRAFEFTNEPFAPPSVPPPADPLPSTPLARVAPLSALRALLRNRLCRLRPQRPRRVAPQRHIRDRLRSRPRRQLAVHQPATILRRHPPRLRRRRTSTTLRAMCSCECGNTFGNNLKFMVVKLNSGGEKHGACFCTALEDSHLNVVTSVARRRLTSVDQMLYNTATRRKRRLHRI